MHRARIGNADSVRYGLCRRAEKYGQGWESTRHKESTDSL